MIKMSPLVVSIAFLASLSVAHADVSHLARGYYYPNLGSSALHTPEKPPQTQYHAIYGDRLLSSNLPNSYAPPPSGSPFTYPHTYSTPQRLSAPAQSPLLAGNKYQSSNKYQQTQQQTRTYQPQQQRQAYQAPAYQAPAYQAPAYQAPAYQAPTYQAPAYQAPVQATSAPSTYSQTQVPTQAPLITKHFYVHAAPEEPEEEVAPRYVQVGRARKNYKIIFIKAPTYSQRAQIIPILPQNEEKTIVYVLSKKPSYEENVQLPELPVTEPSKPDVFFIKYKNQSEAEQAQQSIQAAYDEANLTGADSADQVASRFVTDSDSGSAAAFGGQNSFQGGHSSSTNQVKRSTQRRF